MTPAFLTTNIDSISNSTIILAGLNIVFVKTSKNYVYLHDGITLHSQKRGRTWEP
jgi:hypothetical protein